MDVTQRNVQLRKRVLIADDHVLVAEGCRKLLEREFEVVGIVDDGLAMVNAAEKLSPDIIVSDISMPRMNGLSAAEQILRRSPNIKIVILTMNENLELAAEAFRRGVWAYLLKTCATEELVVAVRECARGHRYISPSISKKNPDEFVEEHKVDPLFAKLTTRQREIIQLVAEGRLMKEIADILHISSRTVAFHKYRTMSVLGIRTNADLVKFAIKNSLIAKQ